MAAASGIADRLAAQLVWTISRHPRQWIVAWALVLPFCTYVAPTLLELVRTAYDPVRGMPSFEAKTVFDRHFPELAGSTMESVLAEFGAQTGFWQRVDLLREAESELDAILDGLFAHFSGSITEVRTWWQGQTHVFGNPAYVSADNRTRLLQVVWNSSDDEACRQKVRAAAASLLTDIEVLNRVLAPKGLEVSATGPHAIAAAVQSQARHDIGLHAICMLPFAGLTMHMHLRQWRLLFLPLLCAASTLVLAFAMAIPVASWHPLDQNVPTLMAFLGISLSFDWCFFLLARILEEEGNAGAYAMTMSKVVEWKDLVCVAVSQVGRNIALSGILIIMCSACMARMPPSIASSAIGGSIVTLAALLICLTLLPACLIVCPMFFTRAFPKAQKLQEYEGLVHRREAEPYLNSELTSDSTSDPQALDTGSTAWYRWAKFITQFPHNALIILCACCAAAPLAIKLQSYTPAVDGSMSLSTDEPAMLTQERLHRAFSGRVPGTTELALVFESAQGCFDGVQSEGSFQSACAAAQGVLELNESDRPLHCSDIVGVAFYGQPGCRQLQCIPWRNRFQSIEESTAAMAGNFTPSGHLLLTGETRNILYFPGSTFTAIRNLYREIWSRSVSHDKRAMVVTVQLSWNAVSWEGFRLVEDVREMLASLSEVGTSDPTNLCAKARWWEMSATGIWYDYVVAAVGELPIVVVCACAVTTGFIAFAFGSASVAIKLLLTVIVPLTWVYGAAVWFFEGTTGLHWLVPCTSSMLLLALALDYNVFFFGRATELRKAGNSDLEALRQGLASTGPVITCAGIIFAIEFSGLMMSEAPLNMQAGFVVVVGILVDTFLVRSCLLPAALSLGADWNWQVAASVVGLRGAAELGEGL